MNRVHGHIKRLSTGQTLYEITGSWDDQLYIKNMQVRFDRRFLGRLCTTLTHILQEKEDKLLLDVNVLHRHELIVEPEERQEPNESRR
jgi:hypothetical protein